MTLLCLVCFHDQTINYRRLPTEHPFTSNHLLIPFFDSSTDHENMGERVIIHLLNFRLPSLRVQEERTNCNVDVKYLHYNNVYLH